MFDVGTEKSAAFMGCVPFSAIFSQLRLLSLAELETVRIIIVVFNCLILFQPDVVTWRLRCHLCVTFFNSCLHKH
jgi:hypothetical protein